VPLGGVKPHLVAVGIVGVRKNPPNCGALHPGVLLPERGQPNSEFIDLLLRWHANRKIVEPRRCCGADWVKSKGEFGTPVGMGQSHPHQDAVLDELNV
jgi:hypothetical protein